MKAQNIIFVLFLLAGCKDYTSLQDNSLTKTFTSVVSTAKTSLDGYSIRWKKGDRIAVNGKSSIDGKIADDANTATFLVDGVSAPYYAIYPASAYMPDTYNPSKSQFGNIFLPQSQKYTSGSFDPEAAIMVAYSNTESLQFNTVVSYLKFVVNGTSDKDRISSIQVSAIGGEDMSGVLTFNPETTSATISSYGNKPVQITCSDGISQGEPIYVAVAARSYSQGIAVRVIDENGHYYEGTSEGPVVAEVGHIHNVPISFSSKSPDPSVITSEMESVLTSSNHPRLLIDDDCLEAIKSKINTSPVVSKICSLVIEQADAAVGSEALTFSYDASGKRILPVSREAVKQLLSCSLAYRISKEQKYLDQAVLQMNAVTSFPSWNNKNHSLDMAEMCVAVGLCYDWLYNFLPTQTKTAAVKAIKEFAIEKSLAGEWSLDYYNTVTNWEQVCCAGLTIGAFAIYEHIPTQAHDIFSLCLDSNQRIAPQIYGPDGNSREGYAYWCYGASFQVMMLSCFKDVVGIDYGWKIAGLYRTPYYFMCLEGLSGQCFNFSDASKSLEAGIPLWYFAANESNPTLIQKEVEKLSSGGYYGKKSEDTRLLTIILPWAAALEYPSSAPYPEKLYYGKGDNPVVTARTGWNSADSFVGFKGGSPSISHGHMDIGSFVYESRGVRWITEEMNPSYSYIENELKSRGGNFWDMRQSSLRWTVNTMNNTCHNTLTINGQYQKVDANCSFANVYENESYFSATLDMTSAYSGIIASVLRTITLSKDGTLTITDKLKALNNAAATIQSRMMTQASLTKYSDKFVLSKNGKTLTVSPSSKSSLTLKEFSLEKIQTYDVDLSQYRQFGYELTLPAGQECIITTVIGK